MARIPFPKGYEGAENLPHTNQILQNCFNDGQGRILPRPHIAQLNTTGSVARGQLEWNGALYQVVSKNLIKITDTDTGAFSIIGTIEGSNPIQTDIGFNHAVIVVPGGDIYTLSPSDTLTNISGNANFVPCVDVTHINGRFVYVPADGSPAFFSDIGAAGTVQAESFFDAEELPDKNNASFNLNNTLYIMGTDSIELFRDTGASPNPYQRVPGALIRAGFIGGLLEHESTYLFIGRKKDHGAGIFAIGAGEAPKISNERIDLILSTYTNTELSNAIPGRIIWRGHDIATFTLLRHSFGFLNRQWFLLETLAGGKSRPWSAGYITEFGGEYFSAFSDKIGKFQKINTDYGERTTKLIGIGVTQEDMDYMSVQSIELGLSQGFNTVDGSVALRMSRDNVTFGPEIYINLGDIGEYATRLKWNRAGGLGVFQGFFGFEIMTTEDIHFSADHITADIRR